MAEERQRGSTVHARTVSASQRTIRLARTTIVFLRVFVRLLKSAASLVDTDSLDVDFSGSRNCPFDRRDENWWMNNFFL